MELSKIGWDSFFNKEFLTYKEKGYVTGRISLQQRELTVLTQEGEFRGIISGRLLHKAATQAELPVIGDWVVGKKVSFDQFLISHILPRKSKISRESATRKKRSHNVSEQVVAANVDTIFIVNSLDQEYNSRRLERYLTMVWDSTANPVIILNKSDIGTKVNEKFQLTKSISRGVPVHITSAADKTGLRDLNSYFQQGQTVILLGSSGVGKSTLINAIIGYDYMQTKDIQKYKDHGRHTTTKRQMIILNRGGIIIDNPGMRAIQLWEGEKGLLKSFEDIAKLADRCRFSDCNHDKEPECAVQEAIHDGELSIERFKNYKNLLMEMDSQAERKERYSKYKFKKSHVSRMKKKRRK